MSNHKLEICAGDIDSVVAAADGGADRVELCSALSEGGVTPSIGFIKEALRVPGIKVHVLIRPRGGDFCYSAREIDTMVDDIIACRTLGVHGVVIGALTTTGEINLDCCQKLIKAADGMSITFHRAFDLCNDPIKALEQIISLGCNRLLTSGQAESALDGSSLICKLVEIAKKRIIIMPGGGVSPENTESILTATGASEIHASARSTVKSSMTYQRTGVSMGAPNSDEYSRKTTDIDIVSQIVGVLNKLDKI